FSSSDTSAMLPADYTYQPGDQGVHIFTGGATLFLAGSRTIVSTDTAGAIAGSAAISIAAAAADHFSISASASVTSGQVFDVTVVVQDVFNNTVANYGGTVTFASSDADPGVVLPADYTFAAGDGGVHIFTDSGL